MDNHEHKISMHQGAARLREQAARFGLSDDLAAGVRALQEHKQAHHMTQLLQGQTREGERMVYFFLIAEIDREGVEGGRGMTIDVHADDADATHAAVAAFTGLLRAEVMAMADADEITIHKAGGQA